VLLEIRLWVSGVDLWEYAV